MRPRDHVPMRGLDTLAERLPKLAETARIMCRLEVGERAALIDASILENCYRRKTWH